MSRISPIYIGVFVLSAGVLAQELALTRIFSVAQWYHFAFMAVGVALLGFGASGSLLAILPTPGERDIRQRLALGAGLYALSTLASYLLANASPFDPFRLAWEGQQFLYLGLYYLALAVPFLFAGLVIGGALAAFPREAGGLYAANLLGSGIGCLIALAGPVLYGGTGPVLLSALLGLGAMLIFSLGRHRLLTTMAVLGGLAILPLPVLQPAWLEIRMSAHKSLSQALRHSGAKLLWTGWNAFSRVDVVESPGLHLMPGLSFAYSGPTPPQIGVAVDGENLSPLTRLAPAEATFAEYLPTALAYQFVDRPSVLIVEPQGGLDVLTALHHDASSVVVLTSNPLVVEAVRDRFSSYTGNVFNDLRVQVIEESPRSYLRRSQGKFDVIQVSLTESFRVVAAGAYSLSENYLYTVEAFQQYLEHLEAGGVLSLSRWIQVPPSEELKALSLAVAALERMGLAHPEERVAAIQTLQTATILVKKDVFLPEQITALKRFCDERQFDPIYFPGIRPEDLNRYQIFPDQPHPKAFSQILSPQEREKLYDDYPFDVSPSSDDRPFFFHFFRWQQAGDVMRLWGKVWLPFGGAGYLVLVALLLLVALASVILIILPLLIQRALAWKRRGTLLKIEEGMRPLPRWRVLIYFSALGLGYLFIEIPLMQRFILFIGQPTYSFALVLSTVLLCSGVGSLVSRRWTGHALPVLGLLFLLALASPFLLRLTFDAWLGQPLPLRLLASVGVIAPLSFLMGIPFPLGIRLLAGSSPGHIPWAWAINGCASVISAILAAMAALSYGFSWVLVLAALSYGVGLVVIYPWLCRS